MWRRPVAVVLVAMACGTAAGCSSAKVGFGIPHQPAPSAFSGVRHDVTGVAVAQKDGCVDVDLGSDGLRCVIWPDAVTEANAGAGISVGTHVVAEGDQLTGTGMLLDGSELGTWSGRSDLPLGDFGSSCSASMHGRHGHDHVGRPVHADCRAGRSRDARAGAPASDDGVTAGRLVGMSACSPNRAEVAWRA